MYYLIQLYLSALTVSVCAAGGGGDFVLTIDFNRSISHAPNEMILRVAESFPENIELFYEVMGAFEGFNVTKSTRMEKATIFLITAETDLEDQALAEYVEENLSTIVDYASFNYVFSVFQGEFSGFDCSSFPGESPCISEPCSDYWGLARISQIGRVHHDTSYYEYRYSDSNDGSGTIVYVADTGVYGSHDEFSDITVRYGFVASSIEDSEGHADLHGHGTHVAGIIAGKTAGVAKNAAIVAVKILDGNAQGTAYNIMEGISFIEEDFHDLYGETGMQPKVVVNLSLGVLGSFQPLLDEIETCVGLGIIYVVAAGNDAIDACGITPAKSPFAITVGAIDEHDELAYFSNWGECIDILAPGEDILSASTSGASEYTVKSGTSMASPYVAGVIARFLSHAEDSGYNPFVVDCARDHLLATAVVDAIEIQEQETANVLLFAGCNNCFGHRNCTVEASEDEEWINNVDYNEDMYNNSEAFQNDGDGDLGSNDGDNSAGITLNYFPIINFFSFIIFVIPYFIAFM